MLGRIIEFMTDKRTPLEKLLSPIESELKELETSDGMKESVHKFIYFLANGLLPSAIDLAERNNYPKNVIGYISNGKFSESIRTYQRVIHPELFGQEA